MSSELPEITVLTRFHDIERLSALDEMLFSLAGQNGVVVKSLILGQNICCSDADVLKLLCDRYQQFGLDVEFHNERFNPQFGDHRSEILNRGIALIKSRYFSILDYDDVVYPSCYIRLIRRLKATEFPIAFAGVTRSDQFACVGAKYTISKTRMYKDLPKARFFIDNQYPIHSYVVDLAGVERTDLYFDEGATRNEDYAFLYRILSKYKFDNEECARESCEYRVDLGGSNTILAYRSDSESLRAWSAGGGYMGGIKQGQRITLDHKDLCDLANFCYMQGRDEVSQSVQGDLPRSSSDNSYSDSELRLSSALKVTLAKLVDRPENNSLTLNIEDRSESVDGGVRISGWCAVESSAPVAALFCVGEDAENVLVSEFAHRADVAEHLGSEDVCFGFSARLTVSVNVKVIAVSRDGKIYQGAL
jgi:hypothetical protein